ncbi:L-aspartate oxidase [Cnuibacter physcomitrellae]|uniref:L-aspartate oxidase n=1 Tax=Cnuibacter physcomitrellae TaxID=1619308 RepID=A0A1X9LQN8_9MICO|nr:L-aspartate oxidase [Cnuibacter physcomitrellae]ARJ06638.1 L-aspartate oxidase [Cnuibacter physcomitrellae]GGI38479.1 L-aspartate oxidase [Cnuibacter physcomitrellae]
MSIRRGLASRVVVVGSGAAGLVTALELLRRSPDVSVTVVTKGSLSDGNTRYAQGGIAAAVMPGDSVSSHVSDTLAAGAGLSDAEAVRVLCSEGPAAITELVRWGVDFDRVSGTGSGSGSAAPFDAGLEGAHSHHRILHAGGDATGAAIELALVRAALAAASGGRDARLEIVEHAFLLDLIAVDGAVSGVRLLIGGVVREIAADAVVLATGGLGQLYPHTTNPAVTTGDGAAAALRAGAVLEDVEFVQFHPTALAVPGSFLVSEAVRGDGAVLVNATGERFMRHAHPLAELAPRDVVARAIAAQMAAGSPVFLDATSLGRDELARRFPTIDAASRAAGFDWAAEPLPVAPAAHYWMGGVATDLAARTSLPGLYAVGEVARTGVHGANRLASNSLLEAVVFGRRAAAALAGAAAEPWGGASGAAVRSVAGPALSREDLHGWMWSAAGLHRSAGPLAAAFEALAPSATDELDAPRGFATVEELETENLHLLGAAVVHSALAREESRGAHFRSDFPDTDPELARPLPITLDSLTTALHPLRH